MCTTYRGLPIYRAILEDAGRPSMRFDPRLVAFEMRSRSFIHSAGQLTAMMMTSNASLLGDNTEVFRFGWVGIRRSSTPRLQHCTMSEELLPPCRR